MDYLFMSCLFNTKLVFLHTADGLQLFFQTYGGHHLIIQTHGGLHMFLHVQDGVCVFFKLKVNFINTLIG